jgi:hypothetical protein
MAGFMGRFKPEIHSSKGAVEATMKRTGADSELSWKNCTLNLAGTNSAPTFSLMANPRPS